MTKKLFYAIIIMIFLGGLQWSLADPVAPTVINEGSSGQRNLSQLSSLSVEAQAGNMTQIDIESLSLSLSYQGFFGNVTGEITLDDSSNFTFYNWTLATSTNGEVFATRVSSVTWTGINCSNSTQRATEETYLGQSASDGDSLTNTYNTTDHPEVNVSASETVEADSCYSTNAFVNGEQDTNRFHQLLLSDGADNIVYSTIIDADQTGFDGGVYDFQLMVGENEHAGSEGATPYYIWVELG